MNIFSFLLSGASFATSLLAPTQWLIPLPHCLPLLIAPQEIWRPTSVSAFVTRNTLSVTPLSQGEVQLRWKFSCETETVFRMDWNFPQQTFIQGVFEQTGFHAQEVNDQQRTTYLKAPGEGMMTLYIPEDASNGFSFSVEQQEFSSVPFDLTYQYRFPWRIFENVHILEPAFFEVRSAVTGYFPQEKDTAPVVCHTKGDLLTKVQATSCSLARLDAFSTANVQSLYSVQKGAVKAFSPALTFSKPQIAGEVIISEVMWAGSYFFDVSLQSDQWIELYNTTDTLLNLAGTRLRGAKPLGDIIFYSDLFIPPKGFVIVGKQGNDKTSLIRNPDKIDLLSLPPTGKGIQLISNQGVVLDETPAPPWPAGKDDQLKKVRSSMQRSWFELPGSDPLSWGDCSAQDVAFRCTELSKNQWRSFPGQNLGTPWQHSVL